MLLQGRPALALAVVLDVALHAGRGTVSAADIAGRLGLSRRGLEPLLQALSRAGVLSSSRGPAGGYRLARPRRGISVGEVVRAVLPPPSPPAEGEDNPLFSGVIAPFWAEVAEETLARLDGVTLDQLLRRAAAIGLTPAPAEPITYVI
ncbi:MAG: Rrf2 family transcriptional regulator [Rhodovarius sp.]|nr:Rrf2 family transcriptional regulator [Rhodovarius sp.]MCX7931432.1 Rrf2 family transcriptional regulator [Rhodovarius sp.]MDW8315048.1 Rrf2 family transcriptional regulator [Rhodovarius sp.]